MRRRNLWRLMTGAAVVIIGFSIYRWSGLWHSPEQLSGAGGGTAAIIILAMASAWAFALPASAFLFITPLLFPPHWSALITTTGCVLGAAIGYYVSRFVGGSWVERFRDGRLRRFFERHSSFLVLFGIRLTPASPHCFVNYAAGFAHVPFVRFMISTTVAMSIKSYVYALAVHNTVGAKSLTEALSGKAMLSLFAVAVLAVIGHLVSQRMLREVAPTTYVVE